MAYQFGDDEGTQAVQKEQVASKKVKRMFENDFSNLNRENVEGAALGPSFYGRDSTSAKARQRLRRILRQGGYKFGDEKDAATGGLDYQAILRGGEPE